MRRTSIILSPRDNVATLLTSLRAGDVVRASRGQELFDIVLNQDVSFGHKVALCTIPKGEEVLKYGMPIGRATTEIRSGDWVHLHNCRSHRLGYYQEKYGANA